MQKLFPKAAQLFSVSLQLDEGVAVFTAVCVVDHAVVAEAVAVGATVAG